MVNKMATKFNEYYDSNHLRINSVLEMTKKIEALEQLVATKANSLDVKKMVPVIHELTEKQDKKDEKNDYFDKQIENLTS